MTNNPTRDELLPCPFCGGEPYLIDVGTEHECWTPGCNNDACKVNSFHLDVCAKDEVIAIWNTRFKPKSLRKKLDDLGMASVPRQSLGRPFADILDRHRVELYERWPDAALRPADSGLREALADCMLIIKYHVRGEKCVESGDRVFSASSAYARALSALASQPAAEGV